MAYFDFLLYVYLHFLFYNAEAFFLNKMFNFENFKKYRTSHKVRILKKVQKIVYVKMDG